MSTHTENNSLNTAISLHQTGKLDEAEVQYQAVLLLEPKQVIALSMLGTLNIQKGLLEAGIALIQKSLAINSSQPVALTNMAHALNLLGRHDEGLDACSKALILEPNYIEAININGNVLNGLERYTEAAECYKKVISINPDFIESQYNLGCTYKNMKRYADAIDSFNKTIQLRPDIPEAHHNLGVCYQDMNACLEAIASYDKAIALNPDYIEAHWNKSLMMLMLGNFEAGWPLYEWGWKGDTPYRGTISHHVQPLWLGEQSIAGKTLLLNAEQGLGDTLQFCRYALMAKMHGAKVIIQAPASLVSLLNTLSDDITIVQQGLPLPQFDLHCPLMSLPLAFNTKITNIPAGTPYLQALPQTLQKWRSRLNSAIRPKVGLAWSGGAKDENDHNRSIPLDMFKSLLGLPAEFHCLQKEIRASDHAQLDSVPHIQVHTHAIDSFADTAALITEMDLIISVDTSVAHLAGALGKPVWVLLPFAPDFRWMLHREDSPWYPSARLFRQPNLNNWQTVIERLKQELHITLTA